MAKAKIVLTNEEKILKDIEKKGQITPTIIRKALKMAGQKVNQDYSDFIGKHRFTGLTEEALETNPKIKTKGNMITMQTGFNISKGGAPAIWLDRGTPKQSPTHFVQDVKNDPGIKSIIDLVMEELGQ